MQESTNEIQFEITKDIPLDALLLPNRSKNALRKAGVDNCADAIEVISTNFVGYDHIGEKTILRSKAAVAQFLMRISCASDQEIEKLKSTLPVFFQSLQGDILKALPPITQLYLETKHLKTFERDKNILEKRFGLCGSERSTLDSLGIYHSVTRERIRQIEAKILKNLRTLLMGSWQPKRWTLDSALISNFEFLRTELNAHGPILTAEAFAQTKDQTFGGTIDEGYTDLLLHLMGYEELAPRSPEYRTTLKRCWVNTTLVSKKKCAEAFKTLNLLFDDPAGMNLFDLVVTSQKKLRLQISTELLLSAIEASEDVELADETAQLSFGSLSSAADKTFRVLKSAGKALHFSDIARQINLLSGAYETFEPVKERNVSNQLVADNRFVPIGKSGKWGLSEWGSIEDVTITTAMEKVLHKAGQPLSFAKITEETLKIRPDAAKNSISTYLTEKDQFTRVGKAKYALTSWRLPQAKTKSSTDRVKDEDFFAIVNSELEANQPIPLPQLIISVQKKTGLAPSTVRLRMIHAPQLVIENREGFRHKFVSTRNVEKPIIPVKESRPLLYLRIQEEIRSILYEKPNTGFKKGDLYRLVAQSVPCLRPTFYAYLSRMEDIRTYKSGADYYAVYDNKEERSTSISIDVDKYKISDELAGELSRPLSYLNINEVDVGLLDLGRLFEKKLYDYLSFAQKNELFAVSKRDMNSLAKMIQCVLDAGIVQKGHHLTVLR